MRRPSLLRATTSDSEGPSQRQVWLFRLAKFLLVLTFVEDGLRMIIHPEGQARIALGLPSVGPSRAAGEAREDYLPAVKAAAFVGGILQTWLAVFVVLATDPRLAASAMAVLAIVNIAVFTNPLVRRTAHVHGIAAYLCRSGASIAGLLALVAHADAEHSQASSALDDPYVRAKKRGEKVQLVSRILVAFYFLFSGVFASSSTWAFVVGIGGAASVASGYKFTYAAVLLSILVLTHGIGSYAAKLGGHKRHRDALMFVGAQDLSVLAALLLLAATGPGGISVDAKYGKGN